MKLIKQIRLEYRGGTSDKVYEVDLCEVGPGQYVVNFRYGRRGTTLRDGSKTPAPVPLAKAESIYDKLVASKRGEGYWEAGAPPSTQPARSAPAPAAAAPPPPPGREQAVLARLRQGYTATGQRGRSRTQWRLSRAIWRAGELGLTSAEPVLLDLLAQTQQRKATRQSRPRKDRFDSAEIAQLLGDNFLPGLHYSYRSVNYQADLDLPEDMFLYVIAWALGRCGSAASIPALRSLRREHWGPIVRVATAALLLILEGADRAALVEELIAELPESLAELCRRGPVEPLRQALQENLARDDAEPEPILNALYLIDNEFTRPALLALLPTLGMQSACFQPMRHIFKLAELRRDGEVFGILAHRFETAAREQSRFSVQVPTNRYLRGRVESGEVHLRPFTDKTRLYLRRRTWRTLQRLGELGDPDYVHMAAGVLLPFTDADAGDVLTWYEYTSEPTRWGGRHVSHSQKRYQDRFGRYWAFSHVLYRNSPRYQAEPGKATFVCQRSYQPGNPPPNVREEAFPKLWEAAPEELLRLLSASRCALVHAFVVKALRACPDFCRRLDVPALIRLLEAPYEVTVELGMELAVQRYDPAAPDHALVLALADAGLDRARQQARQWIEQDRSRFTQDQQFMAGLAASRQAETRAFARELLRQTPFSPAVAEALVGRLIALLRSFTAEEGTRASDTAQTLQVVFAGILRRLGEPIVRDLLEHPLAEVRQFAAELLLSHDVFAHQPPEDVLQRLLHDSAESVRGVGVRLLGQLPEDVLKQNIALLVTLARHELADFRENVRPLLRRLAEEDPAFGRRLAEHLVEALLVPGAPQGIPSHTARLLREDLAAYLGGVAPATVWKLLQSRSPPAQEIGGLLLQAGNVRPEDLAIEEIVKLASHDILSVREASWQMCRASLDRLKADMNTTTRLVDAKWEDSRQFAFGLLRDAFQRGELTPELLVSLCDSVRPDVQQFGREMITRLFADPDGPEYALKLSEHPSTSMQMFAANFLERYAGTSPESLRQLTFYFQSVLSRVNQGRVAKDRVFRFLEKAAETGEESARVVAEVLSRQSATAAITDKARAIEILTRIHTAHPGVAMPLHIRPVEVRNGV